MVVDKKSYKKFDLGFIIWIGILAISLVNKTLQNDTFYTIKIGESIFKNGIDMLDHFSWHLNLPYTYPHWLYDCFIYVIYKNSGFTGIYISSIILYFILLLIVHKVNIKITKNHSMSALATFICALSIGGFVTARAQLVSFILFAMEIYFIECFLISGNKRNLIGLLLISLIICNVHVAVWPFYYIVYIPYLMEYVVSAIASKIKIKKENKFISFFKKRIVLEKNNNIKYLFIVMILSTVTGLITPIGDTPYTYIIKTMMGNSQKYIQEHQMMGWIESPFTIIIAFETIFLSFFSKAKLRDLFMICGLVIMSVISVRHLSLLALVGTICFCRIFATFLDNFGFDVDALIIPIIRRKKVLYGIFIVTIIASIVIFSFQAKKEYIDEEMYPIGAVKYIKENINIDDMLIFNDYNFGSYLLLNDIPVFIDSRADLYTKQFNKLDYDIFDDYQFIARNYQSKFEFYGITHVLIYKKENPLYNILKTDSSFKVLYEDEYFVFYERTGNSMFIIIN